MAYDLIIHDASVVFPDRVETMSLAVEGDRIVALEKDLSGGAKEILRASGKILYPGVIDAHVHFNEPGRTHWEGFASGSGSLAAGGGTAFIDMPLNASPPTLDAASLAVKKAAAEKVSYTDYAFWGGLTPGNLDQMEGLAGGGVVGFKAFLSASGTDDFTAADDGTLYAGMEEAARLGLPVAVHAENDRLTALLADRARRAKQRSLRDFFASRPLVAELEAIQRVLLFAGATGCRLHIVHVSHPDGLALIAEARKNGVPVTCETCPHYLVLDRDQAVPIGAAAKCAPPLREATAKAGLWEHLWAGNIDWIASDHSPAPPELKEGEDYFQIWGGISGCQTTLPLLLQATGSTLRQTLPALAEATSWRVAQNFGFAGKGRLEVGAMADFVLLDPSASLPLRTGDLLYRHRISPFLGWPIHGKIEKTWVRGKLVWSDGALTGIRPGQFLPGVRRNTARKAT